MVHVDKCNFFRDVFILITYYIIINKTQSVCSCISVKIVSTIKYNLGICSEN